MTTREDVDLGDARTYDGGIPHDVFRALRATEPVSWRREVAGPGYWAVTRHRDVLHVLRHPTLYSSWRGGVLLPDPPAEFLEKLRENMLNRDPPEHTALRRLVNRAFSPRRLADLEAHIERHARALIDAVASRGACDFATDVAGDMPLFTVCTILGVPASDRRTLYALTDRMFASEQEDPAAALADGMAAAAEMRAYAADLGKSKRANPGTDLVSELLVAEVDGRRLTDGEFQAFFMLLFNAGSDTTRTLLSLGLALLIDRPALLDDLRADPSGWPRAIEEILRFETPVIQFRRTATAETTLGDRQIREGDKVVVFFPSANRDEEVFPHADVFDPRRQDNDHVAFGYGTHYCLGAPLARMQSRHVFAEVGKRLRRIEATAPPVCSRTNFIRSVRHQSIRFEAT